MKSFREETKDIPVWAACKASSSAPTYFPAHVYVDNDEHRPLVDGGVFANNPSILALAEAVDYLGRNSIGDVEEEVRLVLISLGTGNLQRRITTEDATTWGPVQWVRPLIDVMFDGSSELSNFCARQIVKSENYVRMQVDLFGVSDDLDDASQNNLKQLRAIAQSHLDNNGESEVEKILSLL